MVETLLHNRNKKRATVQLDLRETDAQPFVPLMSAVTINKYINKQTNELESIKDIKEKKSCLHQFNVQDLKMETEMHDLTLGLLFF